jgi:hypothetical protein
MKRSHRFGLVPDARPTAHAVAFFAAISALGCASTQATRLGDNGWRIECDEKMTDCAARADTSCGDKGYTVVGGGTHSSMLGGSTGYQSKTRSSELIIRCGEPSDAELEQHDRLAAQPVQHASDAASREAENAALAPSPAPASTPAATPPAPAAAASATQCVPGATQKCVGPGACDGGQSCAKDGSGFGPCDCGGTPAATVPAH